MNYNTTEVDRVPLDLLLVHTGAWSIFLFYFHVSMITPSIAER